MNTFELMHTHPKVIPKKTPQISCEKLTEKLGSVPSPRSGSKLDSLTKVSDKCMQNEAIKDCSKVNSRFQILNANS